MRVASIVHTATDPKSHCPPLDASAFAGEISVIIPTFNRAAFLPATLQSIFSQTLPVREVLLVDDGSTDETPAVVEAWQAKYPSLQPRFRYLRQENQGKSVALNKALQLVTGAWVAYNDSDDLWLPEKLALQASVLLQFPIAGACFTDARFTNNPQMNFTALSRVHKLLPSTQGLIENAPHFALDARSCIYMQTVLVRKTVMDLIGPFDPRFRVSQDGDFIFRLALNTQLCYVNLPLVEIDRHTNRKEGLTTEYSRKTLVRLKTLEAIFMKWLELTRFAEPNLTTRISRLLRDNRSAQANLHLQLGNTAAARQCLRDETKRSFSLKLTLKLLLAMIVPKLLARHAGKEPNR
ncbi:MAG TPA: glycosyltransferase [Opitutaceae bacterium]